MVASLVVYAGLVQGYLAPTGWQGTLDPGAFAVVRLLLYGLGAAVIQAVLVLRSRWLSVEAGAEAGLAQLQTRLIAPLALAESVGIDASSCSCSAGASATLRLVDAGARPPAPPGTAPGSLGGAAAVRLTGRPVQRSKLRMAFTASSPAQSSSPTTV